MPKGIYAAASAMVVETRSLEVTARNLAHVQTTGYRQETARRTSFAEQLARTGDISADGGAGVLPNSSFFRFAAGPQEPTGAPYDLAISGEGFLRVRDSQGKLYLTRAGHLATDPSGRLLTPEGWQVEGQGGPITIPPEAKRVSIGPDGRITAHVGDGASAAAQVVDQLRLVTVAEPTRMRAENGVYFDPGDQNQVDAAQSEIHQGYLEKANVDSLQELSQMISIQRRYDAAQRALKEQANAGGNILDLLRG